MTLRVAVDPPGHRGTVGTRTWGEVRSLKDTAGRHDPLVRGVEVLDQDVEVNQSGPVGCAGTVGGTGAGLEGQPLTVRWWFERHPSRVPLGGIATQQARPEDGQLPRPLAVQHDLADRADREILSIAHRPMIAHRGRGGALATRRMSSEPLRAHTEVGRE